MASKYRAFLEVCARFPKDEEKIGRDLAVHLRQRVAAAFREGETTRIHDAQACQRKLEALQMIDKDVFRTRYPYTPKTAALGQVLDIVKRGTTNEFIIEKGGDKEGLEKLIKEQSK